MTLTILTDTDVRAVLHSLNRQDVLDLQCTLADAMHYYSTAGAENGCCSSYQPLRTSLKRANGMTTLFMPASSMDGLGIKIVTLAAPEEQKMPKVDTLSLSPTSSPSLRNSSISTTSTSSSQTAVESPPPSVMSSESTTPKGSLTLLDPSGNPTALINAEELTAFRTALASNCLLKKRHSVHDMTVFGAGKQAYWHIRLALILRGSEIHHLNIVNRSFDRARSMIMSLFNPYPDDLDYENPLGSRIDSKTKLTILTPGHTEYHRLLKEYVRSANIIFCTTPSTQPLFPASYLTNPEGRKKGRYIAAIGSYKPHMLELHPDILRQAVAPHHEHRHFHKHQREGGAVVVDSVEACLQEAGEIIQAKLQPDQVVELGELVMLRREAEKQAMEGKLEDDNDPQGLQVAQSSGVHKWLTKGNVIYKSVGLGLMDVVVGAELVRLARERGFGTTIEGF